MAFPGPPDDEPFATDPHAGGAHASEPHGVALSAFAERDPARGLQAIAGCCRTDPGFEHLMLEAQGAFMNFEFARAADLARRAVDANAGSAQAWRLYAFALAECWAKEQALAAAGRVMLLAGTDPVLLATNARVATRMRCLDAAKFITELEEAIGKEHECVTEVRMLEAMLSGLGMTCMDHAQALLDKVPGGPGLVELDGRALAQVTLDAQYARPVAALGIHHLESGDREKGHEFLAYARRLDPCDVVIEESAALYLEPAMSPYIWFNKLMMPLLFVAFLVFPIVGYLMLGWMGLWAAAPPVVVLALTLIYQSVVGWRFRRARRRHHARELARFPRAILPID